MKNVLTTAVLAIALAASSVAMAEKGGDNPRMEPFAGNVATATAKEKKSLYYQIEAAKQK